MGEGPGIFTLSLDTELAWGTFDVDRVQRHEEAYGAAPAVIEHLCELFDTYDISATWALVSHLLVDCRDGASHDDRTQPAFSWIDDWFGAMPCATGLDDALWYAPWLLDRLQACKTDQEIALHGATHMPLGDDGCSRHHAREEIESAVETLRTFGVEPESFVFPRNKIGHVDVLREHGIQSYRGRDRRWYERPRVPNVVRPPLRFGDEISRITPPVVEAKMIDGVVEIPGSQIFRPSHGGWQYTHSGSSIARARKGLRRAAETGRIFHLWFHPFNLGHEPSKDLQRLDAILDSVREFVEAGRIESRPMREVAALARRGRWVESEP
jgi:hypothetical protein